MIIHNVWNEIKKIMQDMESQEYGTNSKMKKEKQDWPWEASSIRPRRQRISSDYYKYLH